MIDENIRCFPRDKERIALGRIKFCVLSYSSGIGLLLLTLRFFITFVKFGIRILVTFFFSGVCNLAFGETEYLSSFFPSTHSLFFSYIMKHNCSTLKSLKIILSASAIGSKNVFFFLKKRFTLFCFPFCSMYELPLIKKKRTRETGNHKNT